jgi:hypothetical protein
MYYAYAITATVAISSIERNRMHLSQSQRESKTDYGDELTPKTVKGAVRGPRGTAGLRQRHLRSSMPEVPVPRRKNPPSPNGVSPPTVARERAWEDFPLRWFLPFISSLPLLPRSLPLLFSSSSPPSVSRLIPSSVQLQSVSYRDLS